MSTESAGGLTRGWPSTGPRGFATGTLGMAIACNFSLDFLIIFFQVTWSTYLLIACPKMHKEGVAQVAKDKAGSRVICFN